MLLLPLTRRTPHTRTQITKRAKLIVDRMSGRPLNQQLGPECEKCLTQLALGLKAAAK